MEPERLLLPSSHDERSARLMRAVEKLTGLLFADEVGDITYEIRKTLFEAGFKNVSCLVFSSDASEDVVLLSALTTYSKDWQTRYFVKRYDLIDPIVTLGRTAAQPFDWHAIRQTSPKTALFFEDAERHGVGANGITIPIRNRRKRFSLVSLTTDLSDAEWSILQRDHMRKLQLLGVLVDCAAEISRSSVLVN